ncbi:MAG: hypothetical protein L0H96_01975 [Humibacillus sp.]|nr:hypothetical protein [Humibacillus sp.]MDN5775662.1 hypothetical protein [Humibacillus sp.]
MNRQGDVWQAPDKVDSVSGQPKFAGMLRVCDPTTRYPGGYVRFYNRYGQPIKLDGQPAKNPKTGFEPAKDFDDGTHFEIRPDGTFDLPKGWNP